GRGGVTVRRAFRKRRRGWGYCVGARLPLSQDWERGPGGGGRRPRVLRPPAGGGGGGGGAGGERGGVVGGRFLRGWGADLRSGGGAGHRHGHGGALPG